MESLALSTTSFSLSSRNSLHLRSKPIFRSPPSVIRTSPFPTLRSSLSPLGFSPLPKSDLSPLHATTKADSPAIPQPLPAQGAKPIPFIISVAIGVIVRFLVPKPVAITPQAWQLLAIFLSTIAGLVLSPLPVGA